MDELVARRVPFSTSPLILVPFVLAGCATSHQEVSNQFRAPNSRGIIFAADGAGGFEATSVALRQAVQETGLPLQVDAVDWSHGYGRFLSDQMDWGHAKAEGQRLAARVAAFRQACPAGDVYLVGHSAGCAVVLTAAEALPLGTVNRIVLLAPSVSADYDLRPALRCARYGVDVFLSSRDVFYLGIGVAITGTADRRWTCPAAGRTGFHPIIEAAEDTTLYCKLREHCWNPCVEWTGNHGGHYDGYKPAYLRAYVLPLFE
jgi:pimeloyl-ACP methyl ester carboxylesterase